MDQSPFCRGVEGWFCLWAGGNRFEADRGGAVAGFVDVPSLRFALETRSGIGGGG